MNNLHPLKVSLVFYSLHIKNRLYYRCPFLSQLLGTRSCPEALAGGVRQRASGGWQRLLGRRCWAAGAEAAGCMGAVRFELDLRGKIVLRWLKGRSENERLLRNECVGESLQPLSLLPVSHSPGCCCPQDEKQNVWGREGQGVPSGRGVLPWPPSTLLTDSAPFLLILMPLPRCEMSFWKIKFIT